MKQIPRRWLIAGAVTAWAAVVLGLAVWSAQHGPETVRPHSELSSGRQTLDQAVETLREQAGPQVRTDLGPYEVTADCRLTIARRGTELDRDVVMTVPEGQEPAVLERLAEQVPPEWQARYFPDTNRLRADAGDFVTVAGESPQPGEVRITLSTGCRPGEDPGLPEQ